MRVILLADVKGQGKKDDIIDVSTGYANNYLIKNKLAVPYTLGSKKVLDAQIKVRQDTEDALVASLNEIKQKLENKTINFKVKTGAQDKVFGKVSTKQISDELSKLGFKVPKQSIILDHELDTLGTHIVTLKLHKKVVFNINVNLVK